MDECNIYNVESVTRFFSTLVAKGALSVKTDLLWLIYVASGKARDGQSFTGFH